VSTPDELDAFLSHQSPFSSVPADERRAAAEAAQLLTLRRGQAALVEDGEPAPGLFVVFAGSVDLVHADQVVDVLEPGESFGHPSLLSGMAPAFSVVAREDSSVVFIPREPALRVLGHPAGAAYVALSLRERLVRAGHTVHGLPELSQSRVETLVHGPPLVLDPETSLRDAARALTEARATAALVGDEGIVTDADLRARGLAEGLPLDAPVRAVTQHEPLRIVRDRTVGEALVDMLEAGRREVCVTDELDRVVGLLGIEDLAGGEHAPFALRHTLARARDVEELVAATSAGLPRLLTALLSAGLAPADVSRALTAQSDTVTMRLLDFAFERHGQAPVAWAWMALGSVARRELTLASDQDKAFAYADGAGPEVDAWFGRVTADVNAGLARCGFGADNAEVLARNPTWRMSAGDWVSVLEECLEHPDRSHLVRAVVSFDFRHVGGGLEIVSPLVEVLRSARRHPDFLRRLARTATDWPVRLGRRGRLATDRDGTLDIKRGAALPIANLARLHAIAAGITISGTLDRLTAAQESATLDADAATALREAFAVVMRVRIEHHAACLRAGMPPDNRVDPRALSPLQRATLQEALREVAAQQRSLSVNVPLGI
jgi:CBS domain-containing protein